MNDTPAVVAHMISQEEGYLDRPIHSATLDKLDRGQFVERLAQALIGDIRATGVRIGLTGEWGSGKTSIICMLEEHIKKDYSAALGSSQSANAKSIATKVAEYAESLAPAMGWLGKLADYDPSGLGNAIKGLASTVQKLTAADHSLHRQRHELEAALRLVDFPLVVMIDELDRIEDEEVRTIAQLVRAIADFPGMSYLLAYDQRRVIEALGAPASGCDRVRRGRAYLEKIVQYQIGLPISQEGDLEDLLYPELDQLTEHDLFPRVWRDDTRYWQIHELLMPSLICTPRDVKRLMGVYRALTPIVRGEVDFLDLFGFAALETKAPEIVAEIRRDPAGHTAVKISVIAGVAFDEVRGQCLARTGASSFANASGVLNSTYQGGQMPAGLR